MPPRCSSCRRCRALLHACALGCALALLLAPEARAQEAPEGEPGTAPDAPEPPAAPEEPPRPPPPPTAPLGDLAGRTRTALQQARPHFYAAEDVSEIARLLPLAEREVAALAHPSRMALVPQLSQRELADRRAEWNRHTRRLEAWQVTLNERVTELWQLRNELVELGHAWEALHAAADASIPEVRRARIDASLQAVRGATDAIERHLDLLVDLSERVSELSLAVEDASEQVRAAIVAYGERLLVRDRPPLWVGLAPPVEDDGRDRSMAAEARYSWSTRLEAAAALLAHEVPAIGSQIVLFALLSLMLIALQRRSRAWPEDDPRLAHARVIARRPVSTALVVALVSAPFAVRSAPIVFYDAVFLLMLVPLARLLAPLSPGGVRPLVYFLAGFLFVNRIEGTIAEGSVLRRVLLLVECTAGVAALAAWAWRTDGGERATRTIRGLAALAGALVAAALVANVLGYVFLAAVLMNGTGFAIHAGLALAALWLIAECLLDVAIRSEAGRRLRSLREHGELVHLRVTRLFTLAASLVWASVALEGYGLLDGVTGALAAALDRRWQVGTLEVSLGAIVGAIAIVALTGVLARFAKFVLELDVLPRLELEPGVDGAVSGLTRYLIVGTGILLAMAVLGIDASQIALVAGALGVGVGFGLQGIVANFIAGIVLMLERPVRLGDFIEVGPLIGRVDRIGLRSSTVRALDGAEVIVPNESLISREVVNWTLSDRKRRVQVKVGVAYGTDPKRVLAILREIAAAHAGVLPGPAPEAIFEGFGESSLDFTLQFWTDDFSEARRLQSVIGIAVHDALAAEGIEIPFPQRDVHVKSLPAAPG